MTVGQLKKFLEKYHDTVQIVSVGADIGGYDATYTTEIQVCMWEDAYTTSNPPDKYDREMLSEFGGKLLIAGVDEK